MCMKDKSKDIKIFGVEFHASIFIKGDGGRILSLEPKGDFSLSKISSAKAIEIFERHVKPKKKFQFR